MGIISGNSVFNFYFLNVDISLTMHDVALKLHRCILSIAFQGTMSQISDKGFSSFSRKSGNKYSQKLMKSYPFFFTK